jgi:RHS repeat-associated protein
MRRKQACRAPSVKATSVSHRLEIEHLEDRLPPGTVLGSPEALWLNASLGSWGRDPWVSDVAVTEVTREGRQPARRHLTTESRSLSQIAGYAAGEDRQANPLAAALAPQKESVAADAIRTPSSLPDFLRLNNDALHQVLAEELGKPELNASAKPYARLPGSEGPATGRGVPADFVQSGPSTQGAATGDPGREATVPYVGGTEGSMSANGMGQGFVFSGISTLPAAPSALTIVGQTALTAARLQPATDNATPSPALLPKETLSADNTTVAVGDDTPLRFSLPPVSPAPPSMNDLPPDTPPTKDCDCACTNANGVCQEAKGMPIIATSQAFSEAPVRYFDGTVKLATTDLTSTFATGWGHTRTWTNNAGYLGQGLAASPGGLNGSGMVVTQLPYALPNRDLTQAAVVINGTNALRFDNINSDHPTPHFFVQDKLTHANAELVLTDTTGDQFHFYDFSDMSGSSRWGKLKSMTDPAGNVLTVTGWTADGKPAEVRQSTPSGVTPAVTESYGYSYVASGVDQGLIQHVTLRRQVGDGTFGTVRQVAYTYYDREEAHGNPGDLKLATIEDENGTTLDTTYYRYYPSQTGFDGLQYVFQPQSFARLVAAVGDPTAATDAQVAPYADNYYEYDARHRVTKEIAQGLGCSSCTGGQGTFTFHYATSTNAPGYNSWHYKTIETLPDNTDNFVSRNIVYANAYGEVMLKVYESGSPGHTEKWATFYEYDDAGRIILKANPSAVKGYDVEKPDLLNQVDGHYQYLRDNQGLVEITDYYDSTTATETSAGGVAGYLQDRKLQRGQSGDSALLESLQYIAHSDGNTPDGEGNVVYPIAVDTIYRNADGTGAETTQHSYTWYADTNRVQSDAVTKPLISAEQNGPGTPDVETTVFDIYGRTIWRKDGDGYLHYTQFDPATGAAVKTITDVDVTRAGDFQALPTDWNTRTGGGLHLVTSMQVDSLGREIQRVDPNGNVTYTVYNDPRHESRVYPGWQAATHQTTGPIRVQREDREHSPSYNEALTMSVAPHVSDGRPDGTEEIGNIQSLSRTLTSPGGQVIETDAYFSLAGVNYSTDLYLGSPNVNYYATLSGYDHRGRPNRVVAPTGTIYRTEYDSLGRAVSTWIGTNDTPADGYWSPDNNTAPANMVRLTVNVYDKGGVGDGNLTQTTQYPGGEAAPRVTQNFYDWRDRLVASKQGVQNEETDDTHRPILYTAYDNLGQAISKEQYDGDGVSIRIGSDGGPVRPAASKLRVLSTTDYDDQGRAFATHVYNVNQTSGTVPDYSLTAATWFNHRGQAIKTAQPGGKVTKTVYDGAGRAVTTYETDGLGDSDWTDAGTVAANNVLRQAETRYDANGNVIFVIQKERFHDETETGELGSPTVGPKARVSYTASYFDAANRATDKVDVGTNGGTAYERPSAPPQSGSNTVLLTHTVYDAAGRVSDITDPRGLVTHTAYDLLGRTTKTVEGYTGDGTPTDSTNRTTAYTYNGTNHPLTQTAVLPGGLEQTTRYIYGVTGLLNSNDLVVQVIYPDNGQPNTESYAYDALSEQVRKTDRNGTVHDYSFDVVGRSQADMVTTLGEGVDGQMRRIELGYDSAGRTALLTSYDDVSGGHVLNQVRQIYNGLGQLTAEYQSSTASVDTSSTPKVRYVYSEMSGGANHSRPVSEIYPNGRVIDYNYEAGVDDRISRLSSLSDSSGMLEAYQYLGLNTVIERSHPQSGVDLTYLQQLGEAVGDAGDRYTGLDRFGRVVDQRWLKTANGSATDRFQYGYDKVGNRLYQDNLINPAYAELYHANGAANGYDAFNRLTDFARGTLNAAKDAIMGVPSHSQNWALDALGNWNAVTTDGVTQNREHNAQNQITAITDQAAPVYDNNGNTLSDQEGKAFVYDAWNRLSRVQDASGATVKAYTYDALNRRITEEASGSRRVLYYSADWQVVEERESGIVRAQNVWSPVYTDALILRDRDANGKGRLTERLYAQQDAGWNVTALTDATGRVLERYTYDPYGAVTVRDADFNVRGASAYAWNYLYQGGRLDAISGLYYFRNRDLNPVLGRWMQQDSAGYVDGLNLYLAHRASPLAFLDPLGLDSFNCTRLNLRVEVAAPNWSIPFLSKIGLYAIKVKVYADYLGCSTHCPNGSVAPNVTISAGALLQGEFGSPKFGFNFFGFALEARLGWYGRLTGQGDVRYTYDGCRRQNLGGGCITVMGEIGGIAEVTGKAWGISVTGGGRAGFNLQGTVCLVATAPPHPTIILRARGCAAVRGRVYGKVNVFGRDWEAFLELQQQWCTDWWNIHTWTI